MFNSIFNSMHFRYAWIHVLLANWVQIFHALHLKAWDVAFNCPIFEFP